MSFPPCIHLNAQRHVLYIVRGKLWAVLVGLEVISHKYLVQGRLIYDLLNFEQVS